MLLQQLPVSRNYSNDPLLAKYEENETLSIPSHLRPVSFSKTDILNCASLQGGPTNHLSGRDRRRERCQIYSLALCLPLPVSQGVFREVKVSDLWTIQFLPRCRGIAMSSPSSLSVCLSDRLSNA